MALFSGRDESNELDVGLQATPGWKRRNWEFVSQVLLPSLVEPRAGESQVADLRQPRGPGKFQVTWIGHASFLIQSEGMNVLVDPNWAEWLAFVKRVRYPGLALHELPRIDLVLVTHAHYDHLHLKTLRRLGAGQPILVPRGVGKIVRKAGFGRVLEMERWQEVRIGGLKITFTPAKHWGARNVHDVHLGFGGFLIENSAGRVVYHCGDSAYFDGFREIGERARIELALLPIGAYKAMSGRVVHMNPEEALQAFADLGAAHLCPMHYGTFPLGGEPLDEPLARFRAGAQALGWEDRVRILAEGSPQIF